MYHSFHSCWFSTIHIRSLRCTKPFKNPTLQYSSPFIIFNKRTFRFLFQYCMLVAVLPNRDPLILKWHADDMPLSGIGRCFSRLNNPHVANLAIWHLLVDYGFGDPAEPESSTMWLSATEVAERQSADDAWMYLSTTITLNFQYSSNFGKYM